MSVLVEGQGVTFTFTSLTLSPISMTVPGYVYEMIETTTLSNLALKTKISATLKAVNDFVLTLEFDPAAIAAYPTVSQEVVITFGAVGTLTFAGVISAVGDVEVETDGRLTNEVTISQTTASYTWAGS